MTPNSPSICRKFFCLRRANVQQGKLDPIKAYAEARGESVNGFINRAIDNQIERDVEAGE